MGQLSFLKIPSISALPFILTLLQEVINFIKSHGLKGPEGTYPKEGQYVHELIKLAEAPEGSDVNDSVICPAPAM